MDGIEQECTGVNKSTRKRLRQQYMSVRSSREGEITAVERREQMDGSERARVAESDHADSARDQEAVKKKAAYESQEQMRVEWVRT